MESDPYDPLVYSELFGLVLAGIWTPGILFVLAMVLLLLCCSALVSGSEIAYFSLSPAQIKTLKESSTGSSRKIIRLREEPRLLLATILIANNFINIAIVILSDYALNALLPPALLENVASGILDLVASADNGSVAALARALNFLLAVVGVTFVLVLFGEVIPKVYAKFNNLQMARLMSGTLTFLKGFFSPLSRSLVKWSLRFENRIARQGANGAPASKKDIQDAIELTLLSEKGEAREIDFLKSIVHFADVTVKQIMKNRVDVVAVDFESTYTELRNTINESGYSRYPVFKEDFDSITGILYTKDLLTHLDESEEFEWQQLIRPEILYVPETKKISELLKEFQSKHMHMAIAVDEYGGSMGIVTLEDIVEEVVGEIKDEFDLLQEIDYEKIDDYNYVFEGKSLINDVCKITGVDVDIFDEVRGESDSFAGLILEITGQIPRRGYVINHKGISFKIQSVDRRRIKRIKMTLPRK